MCRHFTKGTAWLTLRSGVINLESGYGQLLCTNTQWRIMSLNWKKSQVRNGTQDSGSEVGFVTSYHTKRTHSTDILRLRWFAFVRSRVPACLRACVRVAKEWIQGLAFAKKALTRYSTPIVSLLKPAMIKFDSVCMLFILFLNCLCSFHQLLVEHFLYVPSGSKWMGNFVCLFHFIS